MKSDLMQATIITHYTDGSSRQLFAWFLEKTFLQKESIKTFYSDNFDLKQLAV